MTPARVFTTEKFVLRPLEAGGLSAAQAIYSTPALRRVLGDIAFERLDGVPETSLAPVWMMVQASPVGVRVRDLVNQAEGFGTWTVALRAQDELMGLITLGPVERAYWIDLGDGLAHLAVELTPAFTTACAPSDEVEASLPLLQYAFAELRLERLWRFIAGEDQRNIALFRALGFNLERNQHSQHRGWIATKRSDR